MKVYGKRVDTDELVTVAIAGERIERVVAGRADGALGGEDWWLSPGWFDLQVNGYGGCDFNLGAWCGSQDIRHELPPIFEAVARSGTALFLPTIVTNSQDAMIEALAAVAALVARDPTCAAMVPGIHLEGPWLSPEDGPRGAHPKQHLRPPCWDEFRRYQDAANGLIRLVTLAPELEGALGLTERLAEAGVVVAIGHTGAETKVIRDAVSAGATMSTHLGNGAHGVLPRHPNYLWEQLACDELFISLIADGHHLPDSVLKVMARAKGAGRLALVSDAVSLGGVPPGRYANGAVEVLPGGKIVVADTPYLAGAGVLLDACVERMLAAADLTLAEVIRAVTEVPTRILGLSDRKGQLEPGCDADLTLFRLEAGMGVEVCGVWAGGRKLQAASKAGSGSDGSETEVSAGTFFGRKSAPSISRMV